MTLHLVSFERNDIEAAHFLSRDCRASVLRALATLETSPATASYDRLEEEAIIEATDIVTIACLNSADATPELVALLAAGCLYNWNNGGRMLSTQLVKTFNPRWIDSTSSPADTLTAIKAVMEILEGLHKLEDALTTDGCTNVPDQEAAEQILNNLLILSDHLKHTDNLPELEACVWTALTSSQHLRPALRERASEAALSFMVDCGSVTGMAAASGMHAVNLADVAELDPQRRREAFEAIECALVGLPDGQIGDHLRGELSKRIFSRSYLHALGPMLWIAIPDEERPALPVEKEAVEAACKVRFTGTMLEWLKHQDVITSLCTGIENQHLALACLPSNPAAQTKWYDWSIEHPNLVQAIPNGTAWQRSERADELLLVLLHEACHVYSLYGGLGVALATLTWGQLQAELALWSHLGPQELTIDNLQAIIDRSRGVAPLQSASIRSLVRAEQSLELARKARALEAIWSPWLEGLAVFAEVNACPKDDPQAYSPVTAMLYNLWDKSPIQMAEEDDCTVPEAARRLMAAAEVSYASAFDATAPFRLRTYLTHHHRKYFAGYMTVRAIVAAWRSRFGRRLTGAEALYPLLHATRFGVLGAIPDLGLGLEEFERVAVSQHLAWVRNLSDLRTDDLKMVLDASTSATGTPIGWSNGRPFLPSEEEADAENAALEKLAHQVSTLLRGERAEPNSTEETPERSLVREEASSALRNEIAIEHPEAAEFVRLQLGRNSLLPFGRAHCPFWIIEQDHRLACMIRSTRHREGHGGASYDLMILPLSDSSFDALLQAVERSPARRLEVTRIVDLAERGATGDEERVPGRHYLAFRLGDWLHIQPRGMAFGSDDVPGSLTTALLAILTGGSSVNLLQETIREGTEGAKRTLNWLSRQSEWTSDPGGSLSWWAARVRGLAESLLAPTSLEDEARQALLGFTFGDDTDMSQINERGIEPLLDMGGNVLRACVQLLYTSGRLPERNEEGASTSRAVASGLVPLFARHEHGWDFVLPSQGSPTA